VPVLGLDQSNPTDNEFRKVHLASPVGVG
jgi:hypothetical protein